MVLLLVLAAAAGYGENGENGPVPNGPLVTSDFIIRDFDLSNYEMRNWITATYGEIQCIVEPNAPGCPELPPSPFEFRITAPYRFEPPPADPLVAALNRLTAAIAELTERVENVEALLAEK